MSKGKREFTTQEITEIKRLIENKLIASTSKQKIIRDEIRKIGFYFSDFSSKKGYNGQDLDDLIKTGEIKVVDQKTETFSPVKEKNKPKQPTLPTVKVPKDKDELYILDLCDKALGIKSSRQHRFVFLIGDTNSKGKAAMLPVDAYYESLKLVIEYRELQHYESVNFFDKPNKMTVSGVHRGEQREKYDERRRVVLPQNNIRVVEISYSNFKFDNRKRIIRNPQQDFEVIKALVAKVNA